MKFIGLAVQGHEAVSGGFKQGYKRQSRTNEIQRFDHVDLIKMAIIRRNSTLGRVVCRQTDIPIPLVLTSIHFKKKSEQLHVV